MPNNNMFWIFQQVHEKLLKEELSLKFQEINKKNLMTIS